MTKNGRQKTPAVPDLVPAPSTPPQPLIFISHDSRDSELAEAFSKLLRSVSAGMIKTFFSSDKKGANGIDFGEEWYANIMRQLDCTTDVVCLFTDRSLERPWILFEAGVAKGKLNVPVIGVALGVGLERVGTGPFYQFQNMEDSEPELTKLVGQLAKKVPGVDLDPDVVQTQVVAFKAAVTQILKKIPREKGKPLAVESDTSAIAKLAEEMKSLPGRIVERIGDSSFPARNKKRMRRIHPGALQSIMFSEIGGDPIAVLAAASVFRDEMPWLYELASEVYRVAKTGDQGAIAQELRRVRVYTDLIVRHPFFQDYFDDKESLVMAMEFPAMLEHSLMTSLKRSKRSAPPG